MLPRLTISLLLTTGICSAQGLEIPLPEYPELAPEDNAFTYYEQATQLFPEDRLWDELYTEDIGWDAEEVETVVLDALDVLETFREGVGKECVMPGPVDFSTALPYVSDFRSLTRLLMLESVWHEQNEDYVAAVDTYCDALTLGNDMARRGPVIHKLVNVACHGMTLSRIRRSAPALAEDTEALEDLIARLPEFEDETVPVSETLATEYHCIILSLDKVKDDPEMGALIMEGSGARNAAAHVPGAKGAINAYFAQMIAVCKMDYWRFTTPKDDDIAGTTNPLVRQIIPAIGPIRERGVRHRADIRGTLLVLALERYFTEHGDYPETLDLLTPEILEGLPADPFSGEDFRYTLEEDLEYLLYSVGKDMNDDGGLPPMEAQPDSPDIMFSTYN